MDHKHAEELRRIAWGASPLDSLSTVAAHVLADDASVARWRSLLGIVAEPTPAERLYAESALVERIIKRLNNLENAERLRQGRERRVEQGIAVDYERSLLRKAAKEAISTTWHCADCRKAYEPGDPPGICTWDIDTGHVVYCQDCLSKRQDTTGSARSGTGNLRTCDCFACVHGLGKCYKDVLRVPSNGVV